MSLRFSQKKEKDFSLLPFMPKLRITMNNDLLPPRYCYPPLRGPALSFSKQFFQQFFFSLFLFLFFFSLFFPLCPGRGGMGELERVGLVVLGKAPASPTNKQTKKKKRGGKGLEWMEQWDYFFFSF